MVIPFHFCSISLQIVNKFIALETQIHERSNVFFSKLTMGYAYESLGLMALELKTITTEEKILVSGPIRLLQLWLNAIFKPFINVSALTNLARRVESIRLVLLTPEDVSLSTKEASGNISSCMEIEPHLFPLRHHSSIELYGLDWFRREFPTSSPEHYSEAIDILIAFLKPSVLSTSISMGKTSTGLMSYQPILVARKFGFS